MVGSIFFCLVRVLDGDSFLFDRGRSGVTIKAISEKEVPLLVCGVVKTRNLIAFACARNHVENAQNGIRRMILLPSARQGFGQQVLNLNRSTCRGRGWLALRN